MTATGVEIQLCELLAFASAKCIEFYLDWASVDLKTSRPSAHLWARSFLARHLYRQVPNSAGRSGHYQRTAGMHVMENSYKCYLCYKAFVPQCVFTKITKIHTGEETRTRAIYVIKLFSHKSNKNCHSRIHNGEKTYKWNVLKSYLLLQHKCRPNTKQEHGDQ